MNIIDWKVLVAIALVAVILMTLAAIVLITIALVALISIAFITLYSVSTALYIVKKLQNERLERHFHILTKSYYKDDDETSIHVPISFFISSVSTVAFFAIGGLFIGKNKGFFTKNIPYLGEGFYYIIVIVMALIVVHEFSIPFGRLAWTIGKRTKNPCAALVLIICMLFIFITAIGAALILSKYWA